jgi:hypothetical protein
VVSVVAMFPLLKLRWALSRPYSLRRFKARRCRRA